MKIRTLSGKQAHVWQRISALYLLLYVPFLAWTVILLPPHDTLASLISTLFQPLNLIPALLALALIEIHSWIGLRDILLDYTPRQRTPLWLEGLRWLLILIGLNLVILLVTLMMFT